MTSSTITITTEVATAANTEKLPFHMTDIESSVSTLLMTTKNLLETLTAWSSRQVDATQVYDEYNALEIHFASATHAFESVSLPMDDMLHLPDDLYNCLKDTLSKEPCSVTLEQHLPSIRDTILKLLQGLKQKQSLLRERFESSSSKLLFRAQQLSPLKTRAAAAPIPLPSPSSSTEPLLKNGYTIPQQSPISPTSTSTGEEFDMNDTPTKDAMNALTSQENLSKRSSIRKISTGTIALYLKKGDRVKKLHVNQSIELSDIQQLFKDKFNLSDNELIIWILDDESNIEYELENVSDIKPFSILFIKEDNQAPLMIDNEMKNLFNETMHQVLQTIQKQQQQSTTTTTIIPNEKILEQEKEIKSLKQDLSSLKKAYSEFKIETDIIMKKLKVESEDTIVILDVEARKKMDQSRDVTQKAATIVINRLEELQDTIDQIKSDVTQRRCRPSKLQLTNCQNEAKGIETEINDFSNRIDSFKPIWKKAWEVQLQQIVLEQQFLKDQESLLIDLNHDHQAVLQVLDKLLKISEIQERKKQAGISLYKIPAPQQEGFEGMTSVMKQVSAIQVDHSRRVEALAQAEKMRSKELSQRIDVFERELTDYVVLGKLKKIGGAEAIEKQRQEKHKDLMKQIFVTVPVEENATMETNIPPIVAPIEEE